MTENGYARPHSLVQTDWVAARNGDPHVRLIEVDVDTSAYETGHIPGAVGWNWRVDLQRHPVRDIPDKPNGKRCSRAPASATTTSGALRRQQQLVRRLRLLALQVLRACRRVPHGWRPRQVGRRGAELTTDAPGHSPDDVSGEQGRTRGCAPSATTSTPPSAGRTPCSSTSAHRRSIRASCWRRRTCRRKARSAAAISPARRTSHGPPPSPRTAPSSRPTS